MTGSDFLVLSFAALLGAIVGSFLNVCIWRMPRKGLEVGNPRRSHCPSCGVAIAWYDNIPLLSWWLLGGHCRSCRGRISVRYFTVEALTSFFYVIIALKYLSPHGLAFDQIPELRWGEFFVLAVIVSALIVASFIDIDLKILPDEITLTGMMLIPLICILWPGFHTRPVDAWVWGRLESLHSILPTLNLPGQGLSGVAFWVVLVVLAVVGFSGGIYGYQVYWKCVHKTPKKLDDGALAGVLAAFCLVIVGAVYLEPQWALHPRIVSFSSCILGMFTGSFLIFMIGVIGSVVFQKPAMGFGDVKLMGFLGGLVGWQGALVGFALACILGSMVGIARMLVIKSRYLWFGPFLSLGCLIYLLFPGMLRMFLDWYMGLFVSAS